MENNLEIYKLAHALESYLVQSLIDAQAGNSAQAAHWNAEACLAREKLEAMGCGYHRLTNVLEDLYCGQPETRYEH